MAPRLRRSCRPRLGLETLERRLAPANFVVSNLNDAGAGSLRQAILGANGTPGADTISFTAGALGTITLASTLSITDSVTIFGLGREALSVHGGNVVRPFTIDNGNATRIDVTIMELTVTNGVASGDGGGLYTANETVTLTGVVVRNCAAVDGGSGGGIGVGTDGRLIVFNSTISGNATSGTGGGIDFHNTGSLFLVDSTVSGNLATDANGGGGIHFFGAVYTFRGFEIINSTIAGNTAPSGGGLALRMLNTDDDPVIFRNSTITGNTSTTTSTAAGQGGGGIALTTADAATIQIISTIVSGNTATNGRSDIAVPNSAPVQVVSSAIGDPDGFTLSGFSGNNLPYGAALGLGTLANNGGPTQTIAFAPNSPLRNAGSNQLGYDFDQRGPGFPRDIGGPADIGAFEAPLTVYNLADSGAGSLRQAILDANSAGGGTDHIGFQPGLTGAITLQSPLPITVSTIIAGPGAGAIAVSGNNVVRVFNIDNGGAGVIDVTISGLTVTNGAAFSGDGGGLFTANENVTLDGVVVRNCAATENGSSSGGGIGVGPGGFLTVRNSTVSGNGAVGRGGGIYFFSGGSLLLENSTVSGNLATETNGGGGVYFFGAVASGGVTIRNSTIANNTAPSGGGLALRSLNTAAAPVGIEFSTITGNTSTTTFVPAGQGGGGIALTSFEAATINIRCTIVSGNTANNGRSDIAIPNSATVNVTFSAIGDPDGFTRSGNSGVNLPDGVALGLGTLANNGGPTHTIAFAANSPLFNAGSNLANLATDQRGPGFPRVVATDADIGAYELQTGGGGVAPQVSSAVVNGGQTNTTQRSRVTSLTVTFSAQVTFAGAVANAFTLTRNVSGGSVAFAATASVVGGVTVVTLNGFTGGETNSGSLRDGRYTLTVLASQVSAGGTQMASNFTFGDAQGLFRFYGDVTGDRRVDIADFGFFSTAYLQGPGANNPSLDFNGDGRIDITDFGQFSVRFFTTLP